MPVLLLCVLPSTPYCVPSNDASFPQVAGARSAVIVVAEDFERGGISSVHTGFAIDLSSSTTSLPVALEKTDEVYALFYRCDLEAMGLSPGLISTSSRTLVRTERVIRGRLKAASASSSSDEIFDGGALEWTEVIDGLGAIARLGGLDVASAAARLRIKERWAFECATSLCDATVSECDMTFAVREDDHTLLLGGYQSSPARSGGVLRRARFGESDGNELTPSDDAWPLCEVFEDRPVLASSSGARRSALRMGSSIYSMTKDTAEIFRLPETVDDLDVALTSSTTISALSGEDSSSFLLDRPRWMTPMDSSAGAALAAFLALTPQGEIVSLVETASGQPSAIAHGGLAADLGLELQASGMVLGHPWGSSGLDPEMPNSPSVFAAYNPISGAGAGAGAGAVAYAFFDPDAADFDRKGLSTRPIFSFERARVRALALGVGDTIVVGSSQDIEGGGEEGGIHVVPFDYEMLDASPVQSPATVGVRHAFDRPVVALSRIRSHVMAVTFESTVDASIVDVWLCDLGADEGARDLEPLAADEASNSSDSMESSSTSGAVGDGRCVPILRDRQIAIRQPEKGAQATAQTFDDEVAVVTLPTGRALVLEACGLPGVGGSQSPE